MCVNVVRFSAPISIYWEFFNFATAKLGIYCPFKTHRVKYVVAKKKKILKNQGKKLKNSMN
jgi:hypothetical protein